LVGLQVLFFLVLWVAITQWKPATAMGTLPPVSVIVCAHDEEQNLRALVPLILAQSYPEFELILVDDRSNDGTYDYLLELTGRMPGVRMVRVTQTPAHIPGKKFALTLGIRAARHELILVTDADCRPVSTQWMRAMTSQLIPGQEFVIGVSPYRELPGFLNLFIRYEALLTSLQMTGFARAGMPYMAVGRNLLYRKELFLRNKGFNRHLQITGGDDDLFLNEHATRTNVAVCLLPESVVVSEPKTTVRDFLTQKRRHLSAGRHYRLHHRLMLAFFSITLVAGALVVIPATATGLTPSLLSLLVLRWAVLMAAFEGFSNRLKIRFEWWWLPVLDFVYSIYYLVAGTHALMTKKVRWKN
jgi:glycosyltransferase involved in cell wall biosynthesis